MVTRRATTSRRSAGPASATTTWYRPLGGTRSPIRSIGCDRSLRVRFAVRAVLRENAVAGGCRARFRRLPAERLDALHVVSVELRRTEKAQRGLMSVQVTDAVITLEVVRRPARGKLPIAIGRRRARRRREGCEKAGDRRGESHDSAVSAKPGPLLDLRRDRQLVTEDVQRRVDLEALDALVHEREDRAPHRLHDRSVLL